MQQEPLAFLDGRKEALAQRQRGEILSRFYRDEDDCWVAVYSAVTEVGGARIHSEVRQATIAPIKKPQE